MYPSSVQTRQKCFASDLRDGKYRSVYFHCFFLVMMLTGMHFFSYFAYWILCTSECQGSSQTLKLLWMTADCSLGLNGLLCPHVGSNVDMMLFASASYLHFSKKWSLLTLKICTFYPPLKPALKWEKRI